ncbi:tripartite motif-containing protein 2-like [Anneissia japonica]|uniref:tripartite motif-containing protein 2-like n=1 Tax=Anneissia japonica TaxID=1529436 RepID=UPI001425B222|nr:tripartite motif-containing protein 2-like [Anneissia japonica]
MATNELDQFLDNVDEMVLECTICFKRLQNPKSLNCFHSFCLACLEDWVKEKGKLTCPTCSKSYLIPEGGLQKLPPNMFLINLLETIEQIDKRDEMKCICERGEAKHYCQECRYYLCCTCSNHHKIFPALVNHKLHSVEEVRSMSPLQIAALHPPLCSLHNKTLEFFCSICNIPICMHCTVTDHNAWEGNHKPISISEAFQTFKETSATLEKAANDCKNKLQDGLKAVIQNATKLEQSKDTSLRDVNNHLLQSDKATAMQSSNRVIIALKDRINELPKTKPADNGQIYIYINKKQMTSLQGFDIGYVSHMRVADYITLKGGKYMTEGAEVVEIIKTDECEVNANKLKARTQPTRKTNIAKVEEGDNGDYFMTSKCTSPGVCKLDMSANGEPIKQSPMMIKLEKEGLVFTILIDKVNRDVVMCKDDSLLVSCFTNEILQYTQSGEYIGTVTLPQGVKVRTMYTMKNGNIAFTDSGNECIKICNMNGQVVKSIGHGVLKDPVGIYVDEESSILYVGDWNINCVFMFNISNGCILKKISKGKQDGQMKGVYDITLTNQGHLLVLEHGNSRLLLFDYEGRFMNVLVEAGNENGKVRNPRAVVVDEDDNIIISSDHKLQLFSSDGIFIKRIDKHEDGINNSCGLCIISHHPRRVAVANKGNGTVAIFNY